MRLSYIIPVLNSHEVVRRQILRWCKYGLPDDMEVIIMDDGSDPPLEFDVQGLPISIVPTNDTRPWTSSLARNKAARDVSDAEYILMADVDYIIPRDVLEYCVKTDCDRLQFQREFAVLDEFGEITQDRDVLIAYGLLKTRLDSVGVSLCPHPNVYMMRRQLFLDMGGYDEMLVTRRPYPQGEDNKFKRTWGNWMRAHGLAYHDHRPLIYMFPNGQYCGDVDYNPFNLFDTTLSRKNEHNVFHQRLLRRQGK